MTPLDEILEYGTPAQIKEALQSVADSLHAAGYQCVDAMVSDTENLRATQKGLENDLNAIEANYDLEVKYSAALTRKGNALADCLATAYITYPLDVSAAIDNWETA